MRSAEESDQGIPDDKNLVNAGAEKRNGTELIGSNGSDLSEKLGEFTTGSVDPGRSARFPGGEGRRLGLLG